MNKWWICLLQTHSFSLHKMLTVGLEWCGLLVDYCDVFISCWTLILTAPIHCRGSNRWASDVMCNFSKSVLMKKQTHLHLEWPEDESIPFKFHLKHFNCSILFIFWWTIPLTFTLTLQVLCNGCFIIQSTVNSVTLTWHDSGTMLKNEL